jgi:hypothetical protein
MMNKVKKRNIISLIIIAIFLLMVITLITNWPVIYQKGNPIPYLRSMLLIESNQTYVQVNEDNPITFITKRDKYDELHKFIEDKYEVSFDEQMGSGFIFRSDKKVITVTSEIYWKYYIVWTMSVR